MSSPKHTVPDNDVLISKALSYLLRHGALKEKLAIDERGFVKLSSILQHQRIRSRKATVDDIKRIVANNDKKRFRIEERDDGDYICANQGHSISTVSDDSLVRLTKHTIPHEVFHGTYAKKLSDIIKAGGLSRMKRNHIHLTSSLSSLSGVRGNCNVLIYLDIEKCLDNNLQFFKSANGVILSPGDANGFISHTMFAKIVDKHTNNPIPPTQFM